MGPPISLTYNTPCPRRIGTGGVVLSLSDLFTQAAHNPVLGLTCLLVLAVVLVNGWTDAPNAIATVVSTGVLSFRRAVALAAACNLLGVLAMTTINATVAETVYSIADFGPDRAAALSALCAALGWWVGGLCRRLLERLHPSLPLCRRGQLAGAGAMAFLHGAQDGQKFLGVFLLGAALAQGGGVGQTFSVPGWLMLLCAAVMALGTAMGGRRIIETVGRDMVILAPQEGLAADLGGGLCLLLCTRAGLPVSTTHAKTAAILGAGSAGGGTVNRRVAARIALTWLFTFPGCGLLGFLLASLFRSPLSCGILMPGTIF